MIDIQLITTEWMAAIVDRLPLGYAFGAGMMSSVNPCGFAMLPAYLAIYVGANEADFFQHSRSRRAGKAFLVTGTMSLGFVLLFGVTGIVISAGGRFLITAMPWIAVLIGLGLVGLGLWMVLGGNLSVGIFNRLATSMGNFRAVTVPGYFVFGIAFAAASLSCTLPIFLVVVGGALTAGSFINGLGQFISYALGMGAVILFLTLSVAMFKEGLTIGKLRKIMPYVRHVSAAFVLVAGAYIVYYWLFIGGLLENLYQT